MSDSRFVKSFIAAGKGLKLAFKTEHNFRLQILLALVVITLSIYFPLKNWEIIVVVLLVISVLVMELLNTALEYFTDLLKPRLHHYVHMIKDLMAAAVLLTAIGALVVGLIIFLPYFLNLLNRV